MPYIYKERLTFESVTHAVSGVVSTPFFREESENIYIIFISLVMKKEL